MSQAMDRTSTHNHGVSGGVYGGTTTIGRPQTIVGDVFIPANTTAIGINNADTNHLHEVVGDTGGISANHSHHIAFNTGGGSADDGNESRPYSATVLTCIKT